MMRGGKSCENDYYSVMNQIMLRFRPIAPKPSGGEGDSVDRVAGVKKRSKRKYVRVGGRQKKSGRSEKSGGVEEGSGVVTLQLLPPDRSESEKSWCRYYNSNSGSEIEIDGHNIIKLDRGAEGGGKRWITVVVECITEIYTQSHSAGLGFGFGFGVSDREKINNLEMDTCPGFVSDGSNNVVWVNEAYRKLVQGEGEETWLVVKHKLPYLAPSFACRLRMIQQTRHGHKWNTLVPCDVSRMDFPGFAWKLDVNTALRLAI